jgi:hypothetical protein
VNCYFTCRASLGLAQAPAALQEPAQFVGRFQARPVKEPKGPLTGPQAVQHRQDIAILHRQVAEVVYLWGRLPGAAQMAPTCRAERSNGEALGHQHGGEGGQPGLVIRRR